MIIIGSVAAKINDCLPEWRGGYTQDVDVVVPSGWRGKSIIETLSIGSICTKRSGNHLFIMTDKRMLIDVTMCDEFYELLNSTGELADAFVFGVNSRAMRESTLLCLKEAYEHLDIHRNKNDKDIAYWRSRQTKKCRKYDELFRFVKKTAEENLK